MPLGRPGSGLGEPKQESGQAQNLSFTNPGPEFWRKCQGLMLGSSLGKKKKKCLGKRPRIPRMEPNTN